MSGNIGDTFKKIHGGLTTILDPLGLTPKVAEAIGIDTSQLPGFEKPEEAPKAAAAVAERAMPVAPTRDEEQAVLARRRAAAKQMSRRGRASTILTSQEKLG